MSKALWPFFHHGELLLDDQDNEDETKWGQLLVNSAEGFWTEMAKWITALRVAEAAEDVEDSGHCERWATGTSGSQLH